MAEPFSTHEVFNQSPPLEDVNLFETDAALKEAVAREGASDAVPALTAFGAVTGSAEAFERGRLANENTPKLQTYDREGRRLDTVTYHPAYLLRTPKDKGKAWQDLCRARRVLAEAEEGR